MRARASVMLFESFVAEQLSREDIPYIRVMAARRKAQPARLRCQANARERDRTLSVNTAFGTLRRLIPTTPADRKLSKIETLKLATSYIKHLLSLLVYDGVNDRRISTRATTNDCSFCTTEQYHSNRASKAMASTASKSNGSTYSLAPRPVICLASDLAKDSIFSVV